MSQLIFISQETNVFQKYMDPLGPTPTFEDDSGMLDHYYDHMHSGTPSENLQLCLLCGHNTVIKCMRCNAALCHRCLCESTCFAADYTCEKCGGVSPSKDLKDGKCKNCRRTYYE